MTPGIVAVVVFGLGLGLPASDSNPDEKQRRMDKLLGPVPDDVVVGEDRPDPLLLRSPLVASVLGAGVGFGAGHHYAGNHRRGFILSGLDTALGLSLAGVFIAYRRETANTDFSTGLRRRDDERERTSAESSLLSAVVLLGSSVLISRAYQGVFSYLDARATNRRLERYSFVPLPGDS
ncbi:MAG: hypothetical protein AAFP04_08410 [Myxococcota bacterium]